MQDLIRLAGIVAENTPNILPVVDKADNTSLEGRLFQILRKKEALADEDACFILYGNRDVTPSYRMLKSRLRKKLLNTVTFIEFDDNLFSKNEIVHAEAFSLLQQISRLYTLSKFDVVETLADRVIGIAQQAELNDLLVMAYEFKVRTNIMLNNISQFEKNQKKLQHYYFLDGKEREAFLIYFKLRSQNSNYVSNFRKQRTAYEDALPLLKDLWESTGSSKIYNYYHLLLTAYLELIGKYEQILDAIVETEDLLAQGKLNKYWLNEHYNAFIKVFALLMLRRLQEGLDCSRRYVRLFKEGTGNWYAFLNNYVTLALHSKDYKTAVEVCKMVISKGRAGIMVPRMYELWLLIERYVRLVSHKAGAELSHTLLSTEADPSIISKDKDGYNLPLLIVDYIEKLSYLNEKELEQYTARFEKYIIKYLKGHAAARARLILKLLIISMKEDARNLEKKGARHYRKLLATPPTRDPLAEVEIIPYEHLWELVLERLQKRNLLHY